MLRETLAVFDLSTADSAEEFDTQILQCNLNILGELARFAYADDDASELASDVAAVNVGSSETKNVCDVSGLEMLACSLGINIVA